MRLPADVKQSLRSTALACLNALRHQVELIDGEREIVPGVRVLPAPGHTPGHLALAIDSGGEAFLNLGDAAVHPFHLLHPAWSNGFDWAPAIACATRKSLLDRAAAANMPVMAFHFPFPSIGRVSARDSGGWNWVPGC
jgi:glyoxylase-like metal-dependent hydrolase (beta-lactamase superfamily II)